MRAPWNRSLKPPEPTQKSEVTEHQKTNSHISLRDFFAYLGPTLIVSLAYVDPGNYGTDIQAGAAFNYDLIWSVWLASIFAMLLQYLSGKLGIATGKSIPELVRTSLASRIKIVPYWLGAELAIAATDLAEYLGTVIALNILFGIPLLYAGVLGAVDVLILLLLTGSRFRVMEYFFILFVSIITIGFLYELLVVGPNLELMVAHSVSPSLNNKTIALVVGIIGATVMPHALYLHSSLTKNKLQRLGIEQDNLVRRKRFLRIHLRENMVILIIAGCVNASILMMSAAAFFPKHSDVSAIKDAYNIMIPLFGPLAAVIFAVTLLSSGIASSTVGTLAGQEVMDGLLGTKVNRYLRRLVTRFINVFPTTVAILIGLDPLSLLVYSQILLSLMIPLPMIPLLVFTARRKIMGEFVNRRITTIAAWTCGITIIFLNGWLIYSVIFSPS